MADVRDDSRQVALRTMWAAIVAAGAPVVGLIFGIVVIVGLIVSLIVGIIALVVN